MKPTNNRGGKSTQLKKPKQAFLVPEKSERDKGAMVPQSNLDPRTNTIVREVFSDLNGTKTEELFMALISALSPEKDDHIKAVDWAMARRLEVQTRYGDNMPALTRHVRFEKSGGRIPGMGLPTQRPTNLKYIPPEMIDFKLGVRDITKIEIPARAKQAFHRFLASRAKLHTPKSRLNACLEKSKKDLLNFEEQGFEVAKMPELKKQFLIFKKMN